MVNIRSLKKDEICEEENEKEGGRLETRNNLIFRTLRRGLEKLVEIS